MKSVTHKLTDSVRAARSETVGTGVRVGPASRAKPKAAPEAVLNDDPVVPGNLAPDASTPPPSTGVLFPKRVWPD